MTEGEQMPNNETANMRKREQNRQARITARKKQKKKLMIYRILILVAIIVISSVGIVLSRQFLAEDTLTTSQTPGTTSPDSPTVPTSPDELLIHYFSYIEQGNFNAMYNMLSVASQETISREDFIQRNQNIYDGIGANNVSIDINYVYSPAERPGRVFVNYNLTMNSVAGEITHETLQAIFERDSSNVYRLLWSTGMILPELGVNDRVRVGILPAQRGNIYDRNGIMLAGPGPASTVGFVPGRMREEEAEVEEDIAIVAELLEMTPEAVVRRLNASYVRDDTFVLLRTISRDAQDLIDELLTVQGIMVSSATVRYYPLGRGAAHLVGYVQNINAEELEALRDEGYHMNSVIGRAGLERILEDQLRARDGREIFIVDSEGSRTTTVARQPAQNGANIHLHICAHIQSQLYNQFATDNSASVAMNPLTGEVLALVSTPSYDPNDFVRGMTTSIWAGLMEDENLPMFNRFRSTFSPGSTMKAITAAIGIDTNTFTYYEDFGSSGRSWQQDSTWGGFFVTTVTQYSGPANLNNAMAWSDNIYFAKATLKIGAETFVSGLEDFGFGQPIPFEYGMFSSSISRTGEITSEIQLADSGYGQGEVLVNPVHLAVIYSAFVNAGSIIQPRLINQRDVAFQPQFWIENVVSAETAEIVLDSLIYSIDYGTGRPARIPGTVLAGKTGTAELKLTQDDEDGIELGWFVLTTTDENAAQPLLVVSMVENVQGRGGSGYVVPRVASVFN